MQENLHPCPLCHKEAIVNHAPIEEELPEEISQVICGNCGQFVIVTRLTRGTENDHSDIDPSRLDFEYIRNNNHSALVDEQNLLWTDSPFSRDKLEVYLKEQAHRLGGKAAYAVRVLPLRSK